MTRYERYRQQLAALEEKKGKILRMGRVADAFALDTDIKNVKKMIEEAEAYEKYCKPRQIKEIASDEELHEMGIIPLMIECHLVADFLVEVSYMIVDICKEHGFQNLRFMPELQDIIKKANTFASFLTGMNPELKNLLLRNETFNASLHKKYLKYIEQRLQ